MKNLEEEKADLLANKQTLQAKIDELQATRQESVSLLSTECFLTIHIGRKGRVTYQACRDGGQEQDILRRTPSIQKLRPYYLGANGEGRYEMYRSCESMDRYSN
jgi:hypothetical protein